MPTGTSLALKATGVALYRQLRGLTNNVKMAKAIANSTDEVLWELVVRVNQTELERALEREQFLPLFRRLFVEAIHAATAERRKMLAAALAGLANRDDPAEVQSRVARAVMQLEPSDVLILKAYWANRKDGSSRPKLESAEILAVRASDWGKAYSRQALESAQCMAPHYNSGSNVKQLHLTPLGIEVLKYVLPNATAK